MADKLKPGDIVTKYPYNRGNPVWLYCGPNVTFLIRGSGGSRPPAYKPIPGPLEEDSLNQHSFLKKVYNIGDGGMWDKILDKLEKEE